MIKTVYADGTSEFEAIRTLKSRALELGAEIEFSARGIMEDVRLNGFEAVRRYSLQYDNAEPREITETEIEEAYAACDPGLLEAMRRSADNIRNYQSKLLIGTQEWTAGDGIQLGCIVRGIDRLGIYVPGGTAAYPSSVLMNAIPAKVAGVREIIMVTPPTRFLNRAVLAAARIAGVDRIIAVGGVQAVAALTYGAGSIPRVDKIVGPGNAYVAAAKRLAYGRIDIDMVAGPSEVLIIADESADPAFLAADLMSQAEHDPMASAILLTTSEKIAANTAEALQSQSARLSRRSIIEESLRAFGAIIVCRDLKEAAALANEAAPEHLEIMTRSPRSLLPEIRNAGAIFLGPYTPEPLGDYFAGPSHVLPTAGTARFFSPLSVDSFLKKTSVIEYSREAFELAADCVTVFAEAEELTAHANSVRVRFSGAQDSDLKEAL